jgi:probable FeS assembly SUF system protein SufT
MTSGGEKVRAKRDFEAVRIPDGAVVPVAKETEVVITQSLGGSFTIHIPSLSGLYRVSSEAADALGKETGPGAEEEGDFTEERVWAALKTCYDPEIPVNIVDLGLIYSLQNKPLEKGAHRIEVKMTLTAPGCGMGPAIAADAREKMLKLPGVKEAEVEVVWEPVWNPTMISTEGKMKLGIA